MVTRTEELPEEAETLRPPLEGLELRHVAELDDYDAMHEEVTTDLDRANVITSAVADVEIRGVGLYAEAHKIVLDLDHPAILLDSSTPGHHHLYIDKTLTWEQYEKLLLVLGEVGLLEEGYVRASLERRYTSLRLPWVRKGATAGEAKMRCNGCLKHPSKIHEYVDMAEREGYPSAAAFVRLEEGTFNRANWHFWCTACYIAAGQPLGVAP